MTEIREILRRLQRGERARRIARDLGVSSNTAPHLMADLSDTEREIPWCQIEQAIGQFEGPNGIEVCGEVLVGAGTK